MSPVRPVSVRSELPGPLSLAAELELLTEQAPLESRAFLAPPEPLELLALPEPQVQAPERLVQESEQEPVQAQALQLAQALVRAESLARESELLARQAAETAVAATMEE